MEQNANAVKRRLLGGDGFQNIQNGLARMVELAPKGECWRACVLAALFDAAQRLQTHCQKRLNVLDPLLCDFESSPVGVCEGLRETRCGFGNRFRREVRQQRHLPSDLMQTSPTPNKRWSGVCGMVSHGAALVGRKRCHLARVKRLLLPIG